MYDRWKQLQAGENALNTTYRAVVDECMKWQEEKYP
jgi:hypothetical protein